jgi:hypothetical protein
VNPQEQKIFVIGRLLFTAAAFALYAASVSPLSARSGGLLFGADAHLYGPIAFGEVYDRIFRFHPVTVTSAELWMQLHKYLANWIGPQTWLRLLFAAVGAAGVWMAINALSRIIPWRLALFGGALYALTLSVWFFSSIEESKIFSGTLVTLYIAMWMKLREDWTARGAILLTLVLFISCLNEIVAIFLGVIPALDELQRRGFGFRKLFWLAAHGLAFPVALLILETALPDRLSPVTTDEGRTHFSMMLYYMANHDFSFASLYSFMLNWFLFSVAAPMPLEWCKDCYVYFAPVISDYFRNPWRAAFLISFVVLLVAMFIPRLRTPIPQSLRAILLALAAYSILRGAFFFMFNPVEVMLYTPAVMAPHLVLFLAAFAAMRIPAKEAVLVVLAVLLLIGNGLFIIMGL